MGVGGGGGPGGGAEGAVVAGGEAEGGEFGGGFLVVFIHEANYIVEGLDVEGWGWQVSIGFARWSFVSPLRGLHAWIGVFSRPLRSELLL